VNIGFETVASLSSVSRRRSGFVDRRFLESFVRAETNTFLAFRFVFQSQHFRGHIVSRARPVVERPLDAPRCPC